MSKTRLINPVGLYHIYNRGNNKNAVFADEFDKSVFLQLIKKYMVMAGIQILVYCIMDNHFHLFIIDTKSLMSDFMRNVESSYSSYYNGKYDRVGHVFQGPFESRIVIGYLDITKLARYILRNPEKAGMVNDLFNYKWTSIGSSNQIFKITDPKYIKLLFENANINFEKFLRGDEDDVLISRFEVKSFTDYEAKKTFNKILNTEFRIKASELNKQDVRIQLRVTIRCRYLGITINQMKDLTNFSLHFIRRATPRDLLYF